MFRVAWYRNVEPQLFLTSGLILNLITGGVSS